MARAAEVAGWDSSLAALSVVDGSLAAAPGGGCVVIVKRKKKRERGREVR